MASEPGRGPYEALAEASHTSAEGAHLEGGWDVASSLSRHRCGSLPWKRQVTPSCKASLVGMNACVQESLFVTEIFS